MTLTSVLANTALFILFNLNINNKWVNYKATYYTLAENGTHTASGVPFSNNKYTAASNNYPLGSVVLVKRISTQDSVLVLITDRMGRKYGHKRIDLSPKAFKHLAPPHKGIIKVKTKRIL